MADKLIRRGDVYWVDLPDSKGRELKEIHPCLVISNDRQNTASPLITVIPITSLKAGNKVFSFQVAITLKNESVLLVDQIQTIDRDKFRDKIARIEGTSRKKNSLCFSLKKLGHLPDKSEKENIRELQGWHLGLVISNDEQNKFSPLITVLLV